MKTTGFILTRPLAFALAVAVAFVAGFYASTTTDEPQLAGHRIGEFFPRWERPHARPEQRTFPMDADRDAAISALLWVMRHEDSSWLAYYRSAYLRAPVAFRSWLAWPRPAKELQTQAFEALQACAGDAELAHRLGQRLGEVAPDWLPETAAMLARRNLETQVVVELEALTSSADSQQRNAALAALEQHRKPGGLAASPPRGKGSGNVEFF